MIRKFLGMMILVIGFGIITTIFWQFSVTGYVNKAITLETKICEEKELKIQGNFLAIGVLSMLSAVERRNAIRLTWWKICKERPKEVFCHFFTDSLEGRNKSERILHEKENEMHQDLSYMPYKGGHNFALQLIWMLQWYLKRFKFQYFLRIDDDYFLCLNRLLYEIPYRPQKGLYWGWIHCEENIVRVDEGWMLLSRDLIEESINKLNTSLLCHPFGDQAVSLWLQESQINIKYFLDNERIDHQGLFDIKSPIKENICERFIGFHRAYPKKMYVFDVLTRNYNNPDKNKSYIIPDIKPFQQVCLFDKKFDWRSFCPPYKHEPKLCKDNPTWEISHIKFSGREST